MKSVRSFRFFVFSLVFSSSVLWIGASSLPAIQLTADQKSFIDSYLEKNGLNQYGDPVGTVYTGGSPLFDEDSGQSIDRYEYILRNHPQLVDELVVVKKFDNDLPKLETELEMAIKDYQLEANSDSPDKTRLEYLEALIRELKSRIAGILGEDVRSIMPEIFSVEVEVALDARDYGRICDLLAHIADGGQDKIKHEAETLVVLERKLKFRLLEEEGEKAEDLRQALALLAPMVAGLKC